MGDTGSLAIGSGLAALCLLLNLDLLLPIIGGLFVLETLSVIVQVVSFRAFGRRVFRMAPIHHHFELLGWPETTVIVRFWILAGLFAALGLGIFYGEFLTCPRHVTTRSHRACGVGEHDAWTGSTRDLRPSRSARRRSTMTIAAPSPARHGRPAPGGRAGWVTRSAGPDVVDPARSSSALLCVVRRGDGRLGVRGHLDRPRTARRGRSSSASACGWSSASSRSSSPAGSTTGGWRRLAGPLLLVTFVAPAGRAGAGHRRRLGRVEPLDRLRLSSGSSPPSS